jgi:hypothetical protein
LADDAKADVDNGELEIDHRKSVPILCIAKTKRSKIVLSSINLKDWMDA